MLELEIDIKAERSPLSPDVMKNPRKLTPRKKQKRISKQFAKIKI